MSTNSKIEWTDATWNPVGGCSKTSPGCAGCYAIPHAHRMAGNPNPKIRAAYEGLTRQLANGMLDWTGVVRLLPDRLMQPVLATVARMWFVNSLSDLFHEDLPFDDVDAVVAAMVFSKALGRGHIFQVLTKRSARLLAYLASRGEDPEFILNAAYRHFGEEAACSVANSISGHLGEGRNAGWPLTNVWWGVSVEDRAHGLPRIDHLRAAQAHVRILSIEPLIEGLGAVALAGIHQVIVGGESGPRSRPMHPDWVRSLREQCIAVGVPFFFKQWGEWMPGQNDAHPTQEWGIAHQQDGTWGARTVRNSASYVWWDASGGMHRGFHNAADAEVAVWAERVGKKAAGRLLDGRTWDEFPYTQNAAEVNE